jgi:signal transduction histidine kinase
MRIARALPPSRSATSASSASGRTSSRSRSRTRRTSRASRTGTASSSGRSSIRELAEEKDELLRIAAHDIRGPLTVVQGIAELLAAQYAGDDDKAQSFQMLQQATTDLVTLLSGLLDAKAIESGRLAIEPQPCRIRDLIERSRPIAVLAASGRHVTVDIEADPKLVVEVDERRIGQVLSNLLLNAIKFSQKGDRIVLSARAISDGEVELAVHDSGPGLAACELEIVFQPFVQGERGRTKGGSGLGLAIAKKLVELHGGRIWVESAEGRGSRFAFTVPRWRND